jgi:hypothetical protein
MRGDIRCLGLLAVLVLFGVKEARAYTDPGSGALLWQILLGGITGSLFYFRRLTAWFVRLRQPEKSPDIPRAVR